MAKQNHSTLLIVAGALASSFAASAAVPKATCRSTDRAETGVSGETNAADRLVANKGFNCNADLVGSYTGDGASWQLTAWKNCAYFDQRNPNQAPPAGVTLAAEAHPGTVVMDLSDPTHPTPTTWLADPALTDPWESLKVNTARQLLAGGQRPLAGLETNPGDFFTVYDISADCKNPVMKASVHIPGSYGHTGQFAPDGMTYWITPLQNSPSIVAIDVKDVLNPAEIAGSLVTFNASIPPATNPTGGPFTPTAGTPTLHLPRIHDLEFTADGNTAYLTEFGTGGTAAGNGMAILDVSDFQGRKANPQYRLKGEVTWDDGSIGAQNALPITVAGKSYILNSDEGGGGAAGCASGKSANGFPRLIDVTDPAHPAVTAKIQLGVADPANCASVSTAPVTSATGPGFFAHSCHYCNVDNPADAKILACSCFAAGFRVFDIHDPANIKEMAYWKAPARGTVNPPGSQYAAGPGFTKAYDYTTAKVSFPGDRGDTTGDIWITSQDNGFQVIHLASKISVSPDTITVNHGSTNAFTATITGADATAGVNWTIQEGAAAGTIDSTGKFTASNTPGTYHLVATSILEKTTVAMATVTVYGGPSGCSTAGGSLSALAMALAGLLLWRRKRSKA